MGEDTGHALRVLAKNSTCNSNPGLALERLGEGESGTAQLEEAVKAYQNALPEYPGDEHDLAIVRRLLEERRAQR